MVRAKGDTSGADGEKQDIAYIKNKKDVKADDNQVVPRTFDIKSQITEKELRFIELYLTGDLTVDKAMESAGYTGYHKKSLYRLGRKIVGKYECSTGDHRKIFRAIGAGETAVAKGLFKLATTAKSEMVQLNAWATLAKCLGLTKEVVDGVEGIQIVINSSRGLDKPGQHRPAQVHNDQPEAPAAPPGTQITR